MANINKIRNAIIAITCLVVIAGAIFIFNKPHTKTLTINQLVSSYIRTSCQGNLNCRINLADFTQFDWDTACLINDGSALRGIDNLKSYNFGSDYDSIDGKMVFIKNNTVVASETIPLNLESTPDDVVLFDLKSPCHSRSGASFTVKKINDGQGGGYYRLTN